MSGGSATSTPPGRVPLPTRIRDLPALPPAFYATLESGLSGIRGGSLEPAQLERLAGHVQLLIAWNEAINLTGIREPAAIAREHLLDSLTALPILRRAGLQELLDIGSGGGFPGLPLAVALPARRTLLVESIGKKARFLGVATEALGLAERVRIAAARAETLAADPHHRERWPAVVARAVADLAELAELGLPLLRPAGLLIAWKRDTAAAEIRASESALGKLGGTLAAVEQVTVPGLEDHVLVVVEKTARTPAIYPRDPAARRRRPL